MTTTHKRLALVTCDHCEQTWEEEEGTERSGYVLRIWERNAEVGERPKFLYERTEHELCTSCFNEFYLWLGRRTGLGHVE